MPHPSQESLSRRRVNTNTAKESLSFAPKLREPPVPCRSDLDADDRLPVARVLVGVRDSHEQRVVEEAPDELHADRETCRRLAYGQGERRVAGIVEGLGVAGAGP